TTTPASSPARSPAPPSFASPPPATAAPSRLPSRSTPPCAPSCSASSAAVVTASATAAAGEERPRSRSSGWRSRARGQRPARRTLVIPGGLEPPACGLGNRRSILLSYGTLAPGCQGDRAGARAGPAAPRRIGGGGGACPGGAG